MKKALTVILFSLIVLVYAVPAFAEEEDTWLCPNCGAMATGNFCSNCGAPNPDSEWVCPNCGETVTGNFCSNCGTPRSALYQAQTESPAEEITEGSTEETTEEAADTVKVGDTIIFGSYEQDNDGANGQEDIEWLVLRVEDDKALLISSQALDCQPYNSKDLGTSWEACSLRGWLNKDFYHAAFNYEERERLVLTDVISEENSEYGTSAGKDTQDKVFLLSISEVKELFPEKEDRTCVATPYAISKGSWVSADGNRCWWWLRSPGFIDALTAYIRYDGSLRGYGYLVGLDNGSVRPAVWLSLK